ncbi:uncharacterized protein BYT42DRAFT_545874 [Radiomyces spectabilis]|uniref:uncharacterized protein n=1 Tax=Radiomyces spectabilis TaxID=64574 RepID=UPI00222117EB|nr:uncharacterized protein BYT42DRAFT_545874 [Radiomyces spectabilis]KAI8379539.1 hypothetical protein BYT42DRAFT_545874 [Radiomyces spectabilis]
MTTKEDKYKQVPCDDEQDGDEWLFKGKDVVELFRKYRQQFNGKKLSSNFQEVLAQSNVLFMVPYQHSQRKVRVFGCQLIDSLRQATIDRFLGNFEVEFSAEEVSDVATIVYNVQTGKRSIIDAKMDFCAQLKKAAAVCGIADLVPKLPARKLVNMERLNATELQSTYLDPILASLLSDPQKNIILHWTHELYDNVEQEYVDNEKKFENYPGAIMSTIEQSRSKLAVGYGMLTGGAADPFSRHRDTIRLANLAK